MGRYKGGDVNPLARIERNSSLVDRGYRGGPCRITNYYVNPNGYVGLRVRVDGAWKYRGAHRVVWEYTNGPIPNGMQIDHLCRQRDCCELSHLDVVTNLENQLRGNAPWAVKRRGGVRA